MLNKLKFFIIISLLMTITLISSAYIGTADNGFVYTSSEKNIRGWSIALYVNPNNIDDTYIVAFNSDMVPIRSTRISYIGTIDSLPSEAFSTRNVTCSDTLTGKKVCLIAESDGGIRGRLTITSNGNTSLYALFF